MQNLVALYFLLSVWVVFFTSCLGEENEETYRALQLEALKASILEFLGMDAPPGAGEKASHQDLVRMFHQYRRIGQLLRGNATQEEKPQERTRASTVLFPTTGKLTLQCYYGNLYW